MLYRYQNASTRDATLTKLLIPKGSSHIVLKDWSRGIAIGERNSGWNGRNAISYSLLGMPACCGMILVTHLSFGNAANATVKMELLGAMLDHIARGGYSYTGMTFIPSQSAMKYFYNSGLLDWTSDVTFRNRRTGNTVRMVTAALPIARQLKT